MNLSVASLTLALDDGGDVNEAWRDVPAQIVRSLLLRSVEVLAYLIDQGADLAGRGEVATPSRLRSFSAMELLARGETNA
jgi:hypothetical protein